MAKTRKIRIDVPEQGVCEDLSREDLQKFIGEEMNFVSSVSASDFILSGRNYGSLSIQRSATSELKGILNGFEKDDFAPLEAYIESARKLRVVVGSGAIGAKIRGLLAGQQRQEAGLLLALTCPKWLDHQIVEAVMPLRVAAFANPAHSGTADVFSSKAALIEAAQAREAIVGAMARLDKYITDKHAVIDHLEQVYRDKLVLEKPADLWFATHAEKKSAWSLWLTIFGILAVVPLVLAIVTSEQLVDFVRRVTTAPNGSISLGGVAAITVPALFYAWLLKNISRLFVQSQMLADDAAHRRALALTYLGLAENPKLNISEQERALVLNALFRPLPSHAGDDGPPAGLLELLRSRPNG